MTALLLNIAAYSVQFGVLVAAALAVTLALRLRAPRPSLYFWQAVLAGGILLPLLQPRGDVPALVASAALLAQGRAPMAAMSAEGLDIASLFIYAVAGGMLVRLVWLALGLSRLARILSNAAPAGALHALARELTAAIGASARITLSDDVATPATVGVRRPVILLPRRILEMPVPVQRAVIAHELVHVKRRDWLHTMLEEVWCAVMWFHPAARLLVSRLSLSRETVVDASALLVTRDRRAYAEALIAFAAPQAATPTPRQGAEPHLPGVTPLIGRRHLSQRISLIAGEEAMSRRRLLASIAIALLVCSAATASAVSVLPMIAAAAQTTRVYKPGDGVSLPSVLSEVKPTYTRQALQKKIQGSVFMAVVVAENGGVGDVRITRSLDAEYGLDRQAVIAVKQWKFTPGRRHGKPVAVEVTIEMTFTLK